MSDLLNGKKTYLGILLAAVGPAWAAIEVQNWWGLLSVVGTALAAVGAAHKFQKMLPTVEVPDAEAE